MVVVDFAPPAVVDFAPPERERGGEGERGREERRQGGIDGGEGGRDGGKEYMYTYVHPDKYICTRKFKLTLRCAR